MARRRARSDVPRLRGGVLDGPLAFDNAISREAAQIKGITSEVAGDPDILLAPDLEAGNILAKQLTFLANADSAGLVLGAWYGRGRRLMAWGSAVAVALIVAASWSIPLKGGIGDRTWAPDTIAEVRSDSPYRLAIGDGTLDLTAILPGESFEVEASVGLGQLTVLVPAVHDKRVIDEKSAAGARVGQFRLEVDTSGSPQSYFLTVLQGKDASGPALSPTVTDSGNTFVVTLDGSTSITFQKGEASTGGSITVSGTTKSFRTDVQPMSLTDEGPAWK